MTNAINVLLVLGLTPRLGTRGIALARYVSEFASNASHELKTPITAVLGAAELLQQHWSEMEVEQRMRFLGNITEDAQRMERLVTRLLELARIENAGDETAEQIAISEFVARFVGGYGGRVALAVEAPPENVEIAEAHLHSVLANRVDNALRHGADKTVRVRLGAESGRVRIDVRDEGRGVSVANQQRLFQRFFTTERDRGGTGLGLEIVKAIAERRGGRVGVEPGATGSTFTFVS